MKRLIYILLFVFQFSYTQDLIYEFNARKGSYYDSANDTFITNTNGYFMRTGKGLAWHGNGSNSKINLTDTVHVNLTGNTSIVIAAKRSNTGEGALIGNSTIATRSYIRFNGAGSIVIESNTNLDQLAEPLIYDDTRFHLYTFIVNTGNVKIYQDNIETLYQYSFSDDLTIDEIGLRGNIGHFDGEISFIKIYNDTLNSTQRTAIYNEFLRSYPISKQKFSQLYPKPLDLSYESGLIAAYNMQPSEPDSIADISGSGNKGYVQGCSQTDEGLYFPSSAGNYVNLNDGGSLCPTTGNYTWCFRLNNTSLAANQRILGGSVSYNGMEIYSNNGILTLRIYSPGSSESHQLYNGFTQGAWYNVCICKNGKTYTPYINGVAQTPATASNDIIATGSNTTISRLPSLGLIGYIDDFRFYNRCLTENEAISYNNHYAVQASLYDDFKWDAVGSTTPYDWIQGTGVYEVKELTSDDAVLTELKKGTKYLECTSAGTIIIQQSNAYGEWETFVKKGADANTLNIYFLCSGETAYPLDEGYILQLKNNESCNLLRLDVGSTPALFATVVSYVSNNTWYGVKKTRDYEHEFTGFIKGGSFGNTYTAIDVSGGTGTNPYTDDSYTISKYWIFDLDVGDCITLIRKQKGLTP